MPTELGDGRFCLGDAGTENVAGESQIYVYADAAA